MSKTAPLQPTYRLADHVRACLVDGQVILLDLMRDKYIGVGGSMLSAPSCRIADWPLVDGPASGAPHVAEIDLWIDSMNSQGMLSSASTVAAPRLDLVQAQQSLSTSARLPWDGIQWRRVFNIAYANLVARNWLKRYHLAEIASRVGRLRQHARATADEHGRHLQSAASWYMRSRPFVMSAHDECLHDSLALLHFLASERLYPQWLIGVRTRPFAAHSWVQEGDLVLNDLHESVRRYTPIFTG